MPVLFSSHQLELVENLCDDLVILSRGKLVAAGAVGRPARPRGRRASASCSPAGPMPGAARPAPGQRARRPRAPRPSSSCATAPPEKVLEIIQSGAPSRSSPACAPPRPDLPGGRPMSTPTARRAGLADRRRDRDHHPHARQDVPRRDRLHAGVPGRLLRGHLDRRRQLRRRTTWRSPPPPTPQIVDAAQETLRTTGAADATITATEVDDVGQAEAARARRRRRCRPRAGRGRLRAIIGDDGVDASLRGAISAAVASAALAANADRARRRPRGAQRRHPGRSSGCSTPTPTRATPAPGWPSPSRWSS